jgi:spermidine synthase
VFKYFYHSFGVDNVYPYNVEMKVYKGNLQTFAYCIKSEGKSDHPLKDFDVKKGSFFSKAENLHYYSGKVHVASFAIPRKY